MYLETDLEEAWRVFTIMEAVEWRWTLTEALEQPAALLESVLTLRALAGRIDRQRRKSKPNG